MLTSLPNEIINKIEQIEIHNNQAKMIFSEEEVGEAIENLLMGNLDLSLKSKEKIWQPLIFQELVSQEAQEYAKNLKQKLIQNQNNIKIFININ